MTPTSESEFMNKIIKRLGRNTVPTEAPKRNLVGSEGLVHSSLPTSTPTWSAQLLQKQLVNDPLDPQDWMHLAEIFCRELEEVGGHGAIISLSEAPNALDKLIIEHHIQSAIKWEDPWLHSLDLDKVLQDRGVVLYTWGEEKEITKATIAQATLGITSAPYAIAETGSLVVIGDAQSGRSVSLLPPVHVAFVPYKRIHLRAASVLLDLQKEKMKSAVNFITGPSRTSDIEMDSTIGVHGPKYVYIYIIIDENK
ncbi:MAG: LUD domain-containing protein [Acidibacillus sp.]|uniref:Lactate utilization protein C n=1 Tax=Sulfoacidibacillus ferrooxidans TaxID=2005001 RepID=A0A9X2ABJ3_9BACL|nr:LUD domain-containing protein [Sulfoacidibacillus ferrooxidans]MCI0183068.1 Lactate utilization protein C [Sulfoacidibacillus ferrooxidans]MCY0893222.1 LUD domain-containing protein [Acidibacillus sp.]